MKLSATGAQKTRQESKKLMGYSKQWSPGDTMRVIYPIFWENGNPEFAVGAVWGHAVNDVKTLGLKTTFIPSLMNINSDGEIVGPPDITYQFSKIASVFVRGQKALEESRLMSKKWNSETQKKDAILALEAKFDTKNNRDAVKPIIGPLKYLITTEVLSYKIVNGAPVEESVSINSAPLSDDTITKITALLNNKQFRPEVGVTFFELEWFYPTDPDKGQSGRKATVSGVTPDYSTASKFPSLWPDIEQRIKTLATESETIAKRATHKVDERKILTAITNYSFTNSEFLDSVIDDDKDILLSQAWLLREMSIVRGLENQSLIDDINAKFEELKTAEAAKLPTGANAESLINNTDANALATSDEPAQDTQDTVPDLSAGIGQVDPLAQQVANMPDLSAAIPKQNPQSQTIESLLHGENRMVVMEEQVDDINLEMP